MRKGFPPGTTNYSNILSQKDFLFSKIQNTYQLKVYQPGDIFDETFDKLMFDKKKPEQIFPQNKQNK